MKENDPYKEFLRMRSPKNADMIFDMICARNWFSGNMNGMMPVEENREVWKHLKKLIKKS